MDTKLRIQEGIGRLRNRRRVVTLLVAAYVPVLFLVSLVASAMNVERLIYVVGAIYLGVWFVAIQFVAQASCPRCGKRFYSRSIWGGNPWRSTCVHCGLLLDDERAHSTT